MRIGPPAAMARIEHTLRIRYAEPHRAYHGQAHIDAMLAGLDAAGPAFACPSTVELAIWFHDAIYDPVAGDNEERSAALLLSELAGLVDAAMMARAASMIRATATHTIPPDVPPELARDTALFLDLDLAVLGAAPAEYDAYERGIAAEYIPVHGETRFRAGRQAFLHSLLARPRLFLTDEAHACLDGPARANIARILAQPSIASR